MNVREQPHALSLIVDGVLGPAARHGLRELRRNQSYRDRYQLLGRDRSACNLTSG